MTDSIGTSGNRRRPAAWSKRSDASRPPNKPPDTVALLGCQRFKHQHGQHESGARVWQFRPVWFVEPRHVGRDAFARPFQEQKA